MARAAKVNPCKNKGRDLGSLGIGKKLRAQSDEQPSGCCELMEGFECTAQKKWDKLFFILDKKAKSLESAITFDSKIDPKKITAVSCKGKLAVVPCREAFLNRSSAGTRAYNQLISDKSKRFPGCYKIELDLIKSREIKVRPGEDFGRMDIKAGMEFSELMADFQELDFGNLLEYNLAASREEMTKKDWVGTNRNTERNIENYAKFASRHVYHRTEKDFYDEALEKTQTEFGEDSFESLNKILAALSTKQRTVIKAVFMGETDRTYAEIAKSLKISPNSLRDRLKGALKIIKAMYPERAAQLKKSQNYRRSLKKTKKPEKPPAGPIRYIVPSKNIDLKLLGVPHPFGPVKMKNTMDAKSIKHAISSDYRDKIKFAARIGLVPSGESDLPEDELNPADIPESQRLSLPPPSLVLTNLNFREFYKSNPEGLKKEDEN